VFKRDDLFGEVVVRGHARNTVESGSSRWRKGEQLWEQIAGGAN
jgi:hypothetical protein